MVERTSDEPDSEDDDFELASFDCWIGRTRMVTESGAELNCLGVICGSPLRKQKGTETRILHTSTSQAMVDPENETFPAFALLINLLNNRNGESILYDGNGVLAHDIWSELTATYSTPPKVFCFNRHIVQTSSALAHEGLLYSLDYDYWKLFTLLFRFSTNVFVCSMATRPAPGTAITTKPKSRKRKLALSAIALSAH